THGTTPLMHAVNYGHVSAAKLLVASRADVNAKDDKGQTALTLAQRHRNGELIKLLQNSGATDPLAGVITAAPGVQELTAKDTRPIVLNYPRPAYTEVARQHRVQGAVRMRVLVGQDGTVKKMRAITGLPDGLTYEAYRAALQMRFQPAKKDGQPVDFWLTTEVEFHLR